MPPFSPKSFMLGVKLASLKISHYFNAYHYILLLKLSEAPFFSVHDWQLVGE